VVLVHATENGVEHTEEIHNSLESRSAYQTRPVGCCCSLKVSTGGRKLDPKMLRVSLKKIGDSTLDPMCEEGFLSRARETRAV
jgi:hypothetical protein